MRKSEGKSKSWNIWEEGRPDGESPVAVSDRLKDHLNLTYRIQRHRSKKGLSADQIIVSNEIPRRCSGGLTPSSLSIKIADNHILQAILKLWSNKRMSHTPSLTLERGAFMVLNYVSMETGERAPCSFDDTYVWEESEAAKAETKEPPEDAVS